LPARQVRHCLDGQHPFRPGFLVPGWEGDSEPDGGGVASGIACIFPPFSIEAFLETVHFLTYRSYGGAGYGFSFSDVMDMELDLIIWFRDRLARAFRDDAERLRRARGGT
jgi:hypothetical protein